MSGPLLDVDIYENKSQTSLSQIIPKILIYSLRSKFQIISSGPYGVDLQRQASGARDPEVDKKENIIVHFIVVDFRKDLKNCRGVKLIN